jgi:hypothetical protein
MKLEQIEGPKPWTVVNLENTDQEATKKLSVNKEFDCQKRNIYSLLLLIKQ